MDNRTAKKGKQTFQGPHPVGVDDARAAEFYQAVTQHFDFEAEETLFNQSSNFLVLEHIVANLPGHVYWKDKAGVYLGCNDRQANSLGLNRGKEVIGKTDFELPWGQASAEKFRENDLKVMKTGLPLLIEEPAIVDGCSATVLSHKISLRDASGNIMGVLGISIDITKQKAAEATLIKAKEAAEAALKAKEIAELQAKEKSLDLRTVLKDFTQRRYYLSGKQKGIYLTKREGECLVCLARGLTNKEIGEVLKISHRTAELYLQRVKEKFNCKSKSELIKAAMECSFLEGIKPIIG